eukprot:1156455-Pelagomonas_calceolata.AAC.6
MDGGQLELRPLKGGDEGRGAAVWRPRADSWAYGKGEVDVDLVGFWQQAAPRMGMELSCKFGRPLLVNPCTYLMQDMSSLDHPIYTQEEYVENDLSILNLFSQFTVLLL